MRNFTEAVVKAEVARNKGVVGESDPACWCPLCESDIISLALTSIPPRYCRELWHGNGTEEAYSGPVRVAVQKAMAVVSHRPKHRPGMVDYGAHQIRIVNYALEEGSVLVRDAMVASAVPCLCYQCQADTLVLALNRFPPLYGVVCDGRTNMPQSQHAHFRYDLSLLLEASAKAVAAHPHH